MPKPKPRPMEPTHIAIYHHQQGTAHYYTIRLGRKGRFQKTYWYAQGNLHHTERIHVESIPPHFRKAIEDWLGRREPNLTHEDPADADHRVFGTLGYRLVEGVARTQFKFTKSFEDDVEAPAMRQATPGWGSHIEAACLRHLEKQGATHVSTGWSPTESVRYVLVKAGLASWKAIPIQEWIEKIEGYYCQKRRENAQTISS